MKFTSPLHGDMLHARDGEQTADALQIKVRLEAPAGTELEVNGQPATFGGAEYETLVSLNTYENALTARNLITGEETSIVIYWLQNIDRYRISIDDNIWFLRDIQEQQYASLFDNPYLGFLKSVNDQYGTKIHLNLFYQTDGIFQKDDFNLSKFTDRYKQEWKANANWLTLSFHALGEFPDKPYFNADYDQVKRDCDLVVNEILRFAGPEVMTDVTTIHWGEATREASRALRDAGYKGQLGYFNVDDDLYAASYYLNVPERRNLKKRFVWKDMGEDIAFIKTSIVLDAKTINEIVPHLATHLADGYKPPYLDLLIHEQYFYPFYFNYQPDYREKILTAVKWAHEHGYTPGFLGDSVLR